MIESQIGILGFGRLGAPKVVFEPVRFGLVCLSLRLNGHEPNRWDRHFFYFFYFFIRACSIHNNYRRLEVGSFLDVSSTVLDA